MRTRVELEEVSRGGGGSRGGRRGREGGREEGREGMGVENSVNL